MPADDDDDAAVEENIRFRDKTAGRQREREDDMVVVGGVENNESESH